MPPSIIGSEKERKKLYAGKRKHAPYWLDYLLRCRKGEYYRRRFPLIGFVESEKN